MFNTNKIMTKVIVSLISYKYVKFWFLESKYHDILLKKMYVDTIYNSRTSSLTLDYIVE